MHARTLSGGSAIYQSNLIVRGSNHIRPGFRFDRLAQDAQPELDVDSFGASARLTWDLGAFKLYSISAYESVDMFARGDVDGGFGAGFAPPFGFGDIPFPAESGDGIPDHRQLTQEFRLESRSDGPFDWQVGTLIYDEDLKIDNVSYDTLSGSAENGYARQRQQNRAYALFGAAGYQIDDRWRVAGGLRYTDDSKDFYAERLSSPIGAAWFRSYAKTRDGRLLYGGSKGVLEVRPELYRVPGNAPCPAARSIGAFPRSPDARFSGTGVRDRRQMGLAPIWTSIAVKERTP